MASGDERPVKRQKVNDHQGGGGGGWKMKGKRKDPARAKYRAQAAFNGSANGRATAISASGLQSGDVGIFVTSDKGREKGALREMEALLEELIDTEGSGLGQGSDAEGKDEEEIGDGKGVRKEDENAGRGLGLNAKAELGEDIEKDTLAELEEMQEGQGRGEAVGGNANEHSRGASSGPRHANARPDTKLVLVTLDIPCVSFIRLPSTATRQTATDPVDLVYQICREAYNHPLRPRSRFMKRLTPLTIVRKVMNDGIERLCGEVLPPTFGMEQGKQWRYAVRVTVRNNNQVSKDDIIKRVAGFVGMLGRGESTIGGDRIDVVREEVDGGHTRSEDKACRAHLDNEERVGSGETRSVPGVKDQEPVLEHQVANPSPTKVLEHKVDLKHFEKLVLVEVYRNVVGMSIVGGAREFEDDLKRFNLAEIYAEGRKKAEQDPEKAGTS